MKRMLTTITFITLGSACISFLLPAAAFSWNQATHAYIADALAARTGNDNLQEMWGSVVPDFFNYIFDSAVCPGWVSDQTHGTDAETFLKVWDAAESKKENALAYGFLTHNQQWGADYLAHISGVRPDYENDGYIIIKARQLLAEPLDPAIPHLTFGEVFTGNFNMSPDQSLLIAHGITEYAIDIRLGSEVDPQLGRKLAAAARGETKNYADLLVKSYAADYAVACFDGNEATAASVLTAAEKSHRQDMIYLGQAISQPEPVTVRLLAEQLVAILPDLLSTPPGGTLPENAIDIMEAGIFRSMILCDDYRKEIATTIDFVAEQLKDHGITYNYRGKQENADTTQKFPPLPQELVVCSGWHALCSASFDCQMNGVTADCNCLRVNEQHIVQTSAIQDPAVKHLTQTKCTSEHPCDIDQAPVCMAIRYGQYKVDDVKYDWVSTFSYRGWCSLLETRPTPCYQKENGYVGDVYWAVCDGAPCMENENPSDPDKPLTCRCRVEDGPFAGINGSCTGDNGGIMSSSPVETWDFQANSYRIRVPGLEYVQGACAPLTSDR